MPKYEEGTEDGDWAEVDHSTLPEGVKYEKDDFVGRDLGNSVQFNLTAIQQLIDRVDELEMRIIELENACAIKDKGGDE